MPSFGTPFEARKPQEGDTREEKESKSLGMKLSEVAIELQEWGTRF